MEKPADTRYPLHDLIRLRWSPRAFADQSVEPQTLLTLLEAARWAPSSFNEQPWSFIVATKDDDVGFERLLGCLVEGNVVWARRAPALMLSVAKLSFDRNGKPNRHAFHDVGLAAENMVIQATAMGLVVHQMAGFSVEKARAAYDIPATHEPVAAIALGYPGELSTLDPKLQEAEKGPRSRKPLGSFVFGARWGDASPLVRS